MKIVFCIILLIVVTSADKWEKYKGKFRKTYRDPSRAAIHKQIFFDSDKLIAEHNSEFLHNQTTFKIKHNEFSDLSEKDHIKLRGRQPRAFIMQGYAEPLPADIKNVKPPKSLDYRKTPGMLNRIRHQESCGSCYSFGATGALESQIYMKQKRAVELSKQQIVDCDTGNSGCNGGLEFKVYKYAMTHPIVREIEYPYTGKKGPCKNIRGTSPVKVLDYKNHIRLSTEDTKKVLSKIGPVSIGINAKDKLFSMYEHGIYFNYILKPEEIDHAVLLVGYEDNVPRPYWIIKNSWGTTWGYEGYGYITQGKGDIGVTLDINYPII